MSRTNTKKRFVVLRPGEPCVIRTYEVILKPDKDAAYEPRRVTLRYRLEDADKLERDSVQAHREAFLRAVRMERQENDTPPNRQFLDGGVRCIREREDTVR